MTEYFLPIIQVDRVQRASADNPNRVTVMFSARKNHRLQPPQVVVSLLSILQDQEIAIKLGFKLISRPTTLLSSDRSQHLCWIRSGRFVNIKYVYANNRMIHVAHLFS